ncbi:unnamed protein product [Lathyrus sativus]|nr:unnamed protein product [Lathyrus sativus]CAK8074716.1 unnamed protein product [Lathyrus sativus]
MQFVFAVSLFALFVYYSSGFSYIHPPQNSFNAYFSTCLLSMLEKKYMFLICNLILAFLANTISSSSDHFDYDIQSQFSNDLVVDIEDEYSEVLVMKKEEEFYEELVSEEGSSENEGPIEEEELGDVNRDELNRKFEEFIRKMKEEIMIEPKTHPIAI